MNLTLTSPLLALCLACVALMGFAVQRGATCTVVAVNEAITQGTYRRLYSLIEASLWVLGCLLVAQFAGWLTRAPPQFGLVATTLVGGALLGLGAYVNQACVFGAIAKFGSGHWASGLSPVGFFLGCAVFDAVLGQSPAPHLSEAAPVLGINPLVAVPIVAVLMLARGGYAIWRRWKDDARRNKQALEPWMQRVWSPHAATVVIGLTFVVMFLVGGPWAYTDVLAEWAMGRMDHADVRGLLLLALFGGATLGGWAAGRLKWVRPTLTDLTRCLTGGALMGAGSMLIPGGNDGLILMGMPLLLPYAWVAFGTMCITIALAIVVSRSLAARK